MPVMEKINEKAVQIKIRHWPELSKEAAGRMLRNYGPPEEVTDHRLVWHMKGPWKEITLYKGEAPHNFPGEHNDVLEQTIYYRVPPEKFSDLAAFDGSVIADRTRGTLAARCGGEEANFLSLNLAHEIITGTRSVQEARRFYAERMREFMNGQTHAYLQKLLFEPQSPDQARDLDEPVNP